MPVRILFTTSLEKVMFSLCLSVCLSVYLLAGLRKSYSSLSGLFALLRVVLRRVEQIDDDDDDNVIDYVSVSKHIQLQRAR